MNRPIKDYVDYRVGNARSALEAAQILIDASEPLGAINRLYYAAFHAVNALLVTKGLSAAKHKGVRSHFFQNWLKTGVFPKEFATLYDQLFDERNNADYRDFAEIDVTEATALLSATRQFVDAVEAEARSAIRETSE
ncbi:MAG: HEPN domain-containing protein [Candidatus Hydrogenedentes bacterium]|nr:HEPN domain-containing protein [Candidatus Hydrogenedentota bacterium]